MTKIITTIILVNIVNNHNYLKQLLVGHMTKTLYARFKDSDIYIYIYQIYTHLPLY